MDPLVERIEAQAAKVRDIKNAKGSKEAIDAEVKTLLALKAEYKTTTGNDYVSPSAPPAAPAAKKQAKEPAPPKPMPGPKKGENAGGAKPQDANATKGDNDSKSKKGKEKKPDEPAASGKGKDNEEGKSSASVAPPLPKGPFYLPSMVADSNLACLLVAAAKGITLQSPPPSAPFRAPRLPAIVDGDNILAFGTVGVCRYLALQKCSCDEASKVRSAAFEAILADIEFVITPGVNDLTAGATLPTPVSDALTRLEASPLLNHDLVPLIAYSALSRAISVASSTSSSSSSSSYPNIKRKLDEVKALPSFSASVKASVDLSGGPDNVDDVDWSTAGLVSSIRLIFSVAIKKAFPISVSLQQNAAIVTRCGNAAHGDFQCNNAMGLAKSFKSIPGYQGPTTPKAIADAITAALPANPLVSSTTVAPNGFINITISPLTLRGTLAQVVQKGVLPPLVPVTKVLVDFSSPNIAKEMHVGHLRSTIIGDCVCRILEFCGHDVMRVNHVGDWGTQFGMLISHLKDQYPEILKLSASELTVDDNIEKRVAGVSGGAATASDASNRPSITNLTKIYKDAKKRFDEEEEFKERSRLNVVKLQAGDPDCRKIWTLLCDISRAEFEKLYSALGVKLEEIGESFYNPIIPEVIEEMRKAGLVQEDQGMLIVKLPHFEIPLIVRKSDGGYGYDSTDMAALRYRLQVQKRDWVIIITDAGQANHFYMCFDAGRAMGWVPTQRLDHIGFGVVQGTDGKRFKTRSGDTVRLIDLLNEAKDRMFTSLKERAEEGKCPLQGDELLHAAKVLGFGAVKYFDLKQHPSTNYIFSYDRMLDTKGDTAVYLMFAYARVASILRKAVEEKGIVLENLFSQANDIVTLDQPAERALAFELLQFGDVIKSFLADLLPNRLCDYLSEVAVKFTDFVTKCHVLNAPETNSRLILCESTKRVMAKCFDLLGIEYVERI